MNNSNLKRINVKDYTKNKVLEIRQIHSQKWINHKFYSNLRRKILVWKAENIIRKWIATRRYNKLKMSSQYLEASLGVTLTFVNSEHFAEWNKQETKVREIYVEIFLNNYEAFKVLVLQPFTEQLEIIQILLEWSDTERVIGIRELEIATK